METNIPSAGDVCKALAPLTLKQLERLAALSGVPVSTLYKIKSSTTVNPGIETVRLFMPHIAAAKNKGRRAPDTKAVPHE